MKKIIIIAVSLITTTTTIKPMQRLAAKLGQYSFKSIATKSFSGFMTGLHWTIAAGIPIFAGTITLLAQADPKIELQIMEITTGKLTDPSKTTKNFIQEELARRNTPIEDVKVFYGLDNNMGVGRYNCIITTQMHKDLHKAIEKNDESIKKTAIALLNHESNHIKNKDLFTQGLAWLIAPFITHASIKKINKIFVPQSIKINNFWVKQLIKTPSGIGKLVLSVGGLAAFSRYKEQRADDGIENDIDILNSIKADLKRNLDKGQIFVEKKSRFSQAWEWYKADHPSRESRIAKLDQRILLLEKSQQEQKTA